MAVADESKVNQLEAMGIPRDQAAAALQKWHNDIERAANHVFGGDGADDDGPPPLVDSVTPYNPNAWPDSSVHVEEVEGGRGQGGSWQFPQEGIVSTVPNSSRTNDQAWKEGDNRGRQPLLRWTTPPPSRDISPSMQKQLRKAAGGVVSPPGSTHASRGNSPPAYDQMTEEDQIKMAIDASMKDSSPPPLETVNEVQERKDDGVWGSGTHEFPPILLDSRTWDDGGIAQMEHPNADIRVRHDITKPLILYHPKDGFQIFAAVLQALYVAPQFRNAVLTSNVLAQEQDLSFKVNGYWKGEITHHEFTVDPPSQEHAQHSLASLQRLFSMMDMSRRSYVVIEDIVRTSGISASEFQLSDPNGGLKAVINTLGEVFKNASSSSVSEEARERLLQTSGIEIPSNLLEKDDNSIYALEPGSTVILDLGVTFKLPHVANDMYSCLDHALWKTPNPEDPKKAFFEATADVLACVIVRSDDQGDWRMDTGSGSQKPARAEKTPFRIEKELRVDRYMLNRKQDIAKSRATLERLQVQEASLTKQREELLHKQGLDWMDWFDKVINYFSSQNPANSDRQKFQNEALERCQFMKNMIQSRVDDIDKELPKLAQEKEAIFSGSEWEIEKPYDLAAVIMHNGLHDRKSVWTCVKTEGGKWWKVIDGDATEVSEQNVLTDNAGLYLGGGPVMLVYSRRDGNERVPQTTNEKLKAAIDQDNQELGKDLSPELCSSLGIVIKESSDSTVGQVVQEESLQPPEISSTASEPTQDMS